MPSLKMRAAALILIVAYFALVSCAKAPNFGGSGTRLLVSMRFNGPINDRYHYFFLMRNAGDDQGRNGPIPVIEPPYGGNGFATGKHPATNMAAFTDFVEYNKSDQPFISSTGYTLYHVPGGYTGNPTNNIFTQVGTPVTSVSPNGGALLQFEIDLGQLQNTNDPAPNPDNRPRYIQINIIATTTTPANSPTIDSNYYFDAIGDQRAGAASDTFNTFVTIDTQQTGKVYQSGVAPMPDEPTGDSYPADKDPGLDLIFWAIQVLGK